MPSRPVLPPIVHASTFAFDSMEEMADATRDGGAPLYTRWSNPTVDAVEARLAALDGADRALLVGSGMAALHLALWAALESGGPLLVQDEVYGGTHELVTRVLSRITPVHRAPLEGLAAAAAALPPGAVIHTEAPTNPTLRLPDLRALRAAAPGAFIVCDATMATPVNYRPLALGADAVVHAATKGLGGHHDLLAGVVAGGADFLARAWALRKTFGPTLDPAVAARLDRGLATLELRVAHQNASATSLAAALAAHPRVRAVHHPSRPEHPDAALIARDLRGPGGVLSIELDSAEAAGAVVDRVRHFERGASFGGTSALITHPAAVTHRGLDAAARARAGAHAGLLRLSVGVEPAALLWADLAQALDSLG